MLLVAGGGGGGLGDSGTAGAQGEAATALGDGSLTAGQDGTCVAGADCQTVPGGFGGSGTTDGGDGGNFAGGGGGGGGAPGGLGGVGSECFSGPKGSGGEGGRSFLGSLGTVFEPGAGRFPGNQTNAQGSGFGGSSSNDGVPGRVVVSWQGKPVCGDGLVEPVEACDDGGTLDGDGCSSTCMLEDGWTCLHAPSECEM
ncbi:MAG: hypothetical protein R3C68_02675 [Myxococcota bacterium]